jgi:hypothetical protein
MPYIKISDPNVIDLAAWQQVINVVNQHSDSITSITNNFGVSGQTTDWNGPNDLVHQFDPGSQKMIYGKTKVDTSTASYTTGKHIFYGDISFVDSGTTVFSAKPIITATVQFSSTASNPPTVTDANIVCTVTAVDESKFTFRVTDARSTTSNPIPLTGYFYINWVAVGPK